MADTLKLEIVTPGAIAFSDEMAVAAEAAGVEEARQRAQERLQQKLSTEELAPVQAALARFMAEMNVKRRFAGRF
jgi:F0F1-type ATP synthase epsilon subunit